jgi:iron(III) transport system permease protein
MSAYPSSVPALRTGVSGQLRRRWLEFRLIGQDPLLATGLIIVGVFVFLFIGFPLLRVAWQSVVHPVTGEFSFAAISQYVDPYYRAYNTRVLRDTMVMGIATATGGTILGFIFAYTMVRCNVPGARIFHIFALLPTISPPFAIAIASILLFGRNGLITRQLLGIRPGAGTNDIYGLDGLVFVQIITFFPVAYLIIRAMLERIDPSMEEAALSLGASKFHIFRTVTLPLLVPGVAGSFLLLFVESLADLGNPLLLGGNVSVLSTEIFLAISGQYDQQKGAVLSVVLLVPTLAVFLLQRYWVSRRSYISVTGKPTTGRIYVKEPAIRWTFIAITALVLLLVMLLYISILVGSFTRLWGIDYTLDLRHYGIALSRGLNAILSTTFLSAVATPVAGIIGVVIAFLVVRKAFAGKQTLDFVSNLGGAVPGTILGIGYIVAFINPPMIVVTAIYLVLALYLLSKVIPSTVLQLLVFAGATAIGYGINWLPWLLGFTEDNWRYLLAAILLIAAVYTYMAAEPQHRRTAVLVMGFMVVALVIYNLSPYITTPLTMWGRTLPGMTWPRLIVRLSGFISFFTQPSMAMLGYTFLLLGMFAVFQVRAQARAVLALLVLAVSASLIFFGRPLALVGTPYIVVAAYAVRSLPASVRAGIAALQQIDPSIEEASTNLGANSQYTFRNVTLPLILPAFIAGLIFAFARHMTSLSAIIFLTTAEWPILTVWILSEVEQGGMSTAAAYSMILIYIVLAAIGLMYLWLGRTYRSGPSVDLSLGGG